MEKEFASMTRSKLFAYARKHNVSVPKSIKIKKSSVLRDVLENEYRNMTIAELKCIAKEERIDLGNSKKKQEIIDAVLEKRIKEYSGDLEIEEYFDKLKTLDDSNRVFLECKKGEGTNTLAMYTVCPLCGTEVYLTYQTKDFINKIDEEKKIIKFFDKCPKCCAKLGFLDGECIWNYEDLDPDKYFGEIERQLREKLEGEYTEEITRYIKEIEKGKDLESENDVAKIITEDKKSIMEYMLYMIHIESEVYLLKKRVVSLKLLSDEINKKANLNRALIKEMGLNAANAKTFDLSGEIEVIKAEIKNPEDYYKRGVKIDEDMLGVEKPVEPHIELPSKPIEPKKPILKNSQEPIEPNYKSPGFFNSKKILAENELLRKEYEAALNRYKDDCKSDDEAQASYINLMEEYKKEILDYENKVKERKDAEDEYKRRLIEYDKAYNGLKKKASENQKNEFIKKKKIELKKKEAKICEVKNEVEIVTQHHIETIPQESMIALIELEIKELLDELKKIIEVRDELYKYNVIYGKYRNYVALTTIYEYLDSGRCSSLEGAEGAYNLFESETRTNEIVFQLNTIVSSLEDIKSNQFMLYKELKKVNEYLDSIDESTNRLIHELENIEIDIKDVKELLVDIDYGVNEMNFSLGDLSSISEQNLKVLSATYDNTSKIAENSSFIAHNSAVTAHYSAVAAHYSKVNAELTNALGFMMAFK